MATVTQNIVDELRSDILAGKYNARARFLSEAQIMRRFGVARQTAVRALERLAQDGLVSRKKGSGTFITDSARNRTGMIGLIVPGLAYAEIFAPICSALSRLCSQKGYTLHLADFASEDPVERARLAEMVASDFAQRHVAGVIFQPVEFLADSDAINERIVSRLGAAKIPVVLLGGEVPPAGFPCDSVGINYLAHGRRTRVNLSSPTARHDFNLLSHGELFGDVAIRLMLQRLSYGPKHPPAEVYLDLPRLGSMTNGKRK